LTEHSCNDHQLHIMHTSFGTIISRGVAINKTNTAPYCYIQWSLINQIFKS